MSVLVIEFRAVLIIRIPVCLDLVIGSIPHALMFVELRIQCALCQGPRSFIVCGVLSILPRLLFRSILFWELGLVSNFSPSAAILQAQLLLILTLFL